MPAHVAAVFNACPVAARERLLALRHLIFDTAATTDGVGPLTETLKWGEPAYLTEVSRSGSAIRLGWKASRPQQCAVYFNCKTTLVDTFCSLFPEELVFQGNRAILLDLSAPLPEMPLALCFSMAMTYHRKKR